MRRLSIALGAVLVVLFSLLGGANANAATGKRVILYYQTQYNNGQYVSPLGLTSHKTGTTDVIVGAVHLDANSVVHLNDDPPTAAKYTQMWTDLHAMQKQGVHVLAMVGGAAQGSFQRLDTDFATYYPLLRDLVRTYGLSGVDLDVEESMSLAGLERVIGALRADFGAGFIVTLAPVATELSGGGGLSGVDYDRLYRDKGSEISWFNAQLYCGWGSLANTSSYDRIMSHGVVPASKVVAGTLTNPANCGSGYVSMTTLKSTIKKLVAKYPGFGGVDGWEYFNSLPGGTSAPWQWAANVRSALGS
ncbi:chitinase [Solihabitans fulvus]|uniref:Chitinase n=1 Tax=Solihabitans fulvus TaxID=1892852 RepID=A0A5B2WI94_9PSEU|nr:glycosyl hydrolase family 18 protein [Solihabitans fulvus]KAA2250136.1 chitinase [Solihabitans fulvus]